MSRALVLTALVAVSIIACQNTPDPTPDGPGAPDVSSSAAAATSEAASSTAAASSEAPKPPSAEEIQAFNDKLAKAKADYASEHEALMGELETTPDQKATLMDFITKWLDWITSIAGDIARFAGVEGAAEAVSAVQTLKGSLTQAKALIEGGEAAKAMGAVQGATWK